MGKKSKRREREREAATSVPDVVRAPVVEPDVEPAPAPDAAAAPLPPVEVPEVAFASVRRVLDGLEGARLCYGEPVEMHGRTVVPVARVKASGGLGFGRGWGVRSGGEDGAGSGGGGGGNVEAVPLGLLVVGPDGAHFEPIPDPEAPARAAKLLASAAATLLTAVAGAAALRRGGAVPGTTRRRGVAGLLRRG